MLGFHGFTTLHQVFLLKFAKFGRFQGLPCVCSHLNAFLWFLVHFLYEHHFGGAINSPRFHHFKWCFTSPSNRGQSWLRHQFSGEILRSTCSTVHPPIFKEMSHPFPVPLHHTETLPLWQFTRGIAGSRGRARRLGQTVVQWEISRILKWRYCTI